MFSNSFRTLNSICSNRLMNGFDISMTNRLFSSLMKLIRPDKIEIDNATAAWALDTLGYTVEKLMFEVNNTPCYLARSFENIVVHDIENSLLLSISFLY